MVRGLVSRAAVAGFLLTAFALAAAPAARAATLTEFWQRDDFATSGYTARTIALFDPTGLTGVGQERVPVTYLSLTIYLNGVGQSFLTAAIPNLGFFGDEKDPYVRYDDGVRSGVHQLDLGGNPRLSMGNDVALLMGGPNMTLFFGFTGRDDYDRVSSEVTGLPVPEPSLALMLGLGVWALRRRAGR